MRTAVSASALRVCSQLCKQSGMLDAEVCLFLLHRRQPYLLTAEALSPGDQLRVSFNHFQHRWYSSTHLDTDFYSAHLPKRMSMTQGL